MVCISQSHTPNGPLPSFWFTAWDGVWDSAFSPRPGVTGAAPLRTTSGEPLGFPPPAVGTWLHQGGRLAWQTGSLGSLRGRKDDPLWGSLAPGGSSEGKNTAQQNPLLTSGYTELLPRPSSAVLTQGYRAQPPHPAESPHTWCRHWKKCLKLESTSDSLLLASFDCPREWAKPAGPILVTPFTDEKNHQERKRTTHLPNCWQKQSESHVSTLTSLISLQ